MKPAAPAVIALLANSNQMVVHEEYTFTLAGESENGTQLRLLGTSGDPDIIPSPPVTQPAAPPSVARQWFSSVYNSGPYAGLLNVPFADPHDILVAVGEIMVSSSGGSVTAYAIYAEVPNADSVEIGQLSNGYLQLTPLNYAGVQVLRGADLVGTFVDHTLDRRITVKRGSIKSAVGLAVGSCDMTLMFSPTMTANVGNANVPLATLAQNGGFDAARVQVVRVFSYSHGNVAGNIQLFSGRVAELPAITAVSIEVSAVDDLELLNIKLPRNLYEAQCIWTVYDAGCRLDRAANSENGVVLAGSNASQIVHNMAANAGTYDQGELTLTGANASVVYESRTIRSHTANLVVLAYPFSDAPAIGSTFVASAGCNRSQENCARLGNTDHIRFYPYIPTAETSY